MQFLYTVANQAWAMCPLKRQEEIKQRLTCVVLFYLKKSKLPFDGREMPFSRGVRNRIGSAPSFPFPDSVTSTLHRISIAYFLVRFFLNLLEQSIDKRLRFYCSVSLCFMVLFVGLPLTPKSKRHS